MASLCDGVSEQSCHALQVEHRRRGMQPFEIGRELLFVGNSARSVDACEQRMHAILRQCGDRIGYYGTGSNRKHYYKYLFLRQNFIRSLGRIVNCCVPASLTLTAVSDCKRRAFNASSSGMNQSRLSAVTASLQACASPSRRCVSSHSNENKCDPSCSVCGVMRASRGSHRHSL